MYVEDNRINALLFGEIVQLNGSIELRVAETAAEALEAAREFKPQVLVLDANLPDMSGYDLLPRLRALPGLELVPAFMCSADVTPQHLQRAAAAGFAGFWTKPIDIKRLMGDLTAIVAESSSR